MVKVLGLNPPAAPLANGGALNMAPSPHLHPLLVSKQKKKIPPTETLCAFSM